MKTPVAFLIGLVACIASAAVAVIIVEQLDAAPSARRESRTVDSRLGDLTRRIDELALMLDGAPGAGPSSAVSPADAARMDALATRLEKLAAALDERRARMRAAEKRNAALVQELSGENAQGAGDPAADSEETVRELARKAAREARRQTQREETRRRMESMRPMFENMIAGRVDSLAERAGLDAVQKEKVKGIYLTYSEKFMQTGLRRRELTTEDMTDEERQAIREQSRAEFESLRSAQEAEIAAALSEEQFAVYQDWRQESGGGPFGRGPGRRSRDN